MSALDLLDDGLLLADGADAVPEGKCHACGARAGRVPCRACGKATCASDLWTMFALCRLCVPEERMARWHLRGEVDAENWLTAGPAKAPAEGATAAAAQQDPDGAQPAAERPAGGLP